jgi:hypothetical protein
MPLTREQIRRALGEVDDAALARIMATGATPEELAEAQAWVVNDEPLLNTGKALPKGRVGMLAEILMTLDADDQEPPG